MRDLFPVEENEFLELFKEFQDLEKNTANLHNPANYTLNLMPLLAEAAGHPETKLKIIHVAGTKGKGSTSQFTSALIEASGHSVGLFTSPHLATVRERFLINNRLPEYHVLKQTGIALIEEFRKRLLQPSMFELYTVFALKLFADHGLEYAVMETGLGGTLDATNFIEAPLCCAITPVSFDHMALLGNTIEEIAAQKAGIIKPHIPVCLGLQPYAAAETVIRSRAEALSSPILKPRSFDECHPFIQDDWPLFQKENFALAAAVIRQLGLCPSSDVFRMPQLRARCEVVSREPLTILDAAHNADSMRRLVQALQSLYPSVRFTVILGSVPGKDIAGIVSQLSALDADVILTNPHTPRGSALPQLLDEARKCNLNIKGIIPELTTREQLPSNTPLLFTGSFFTAAIGEALFNKN